MQSYPENISKLIEIDKFYDPVTKTLDLSSKNVSGKDIHDFIIPFIKKHPEILIFNLSDNREKDPNAISATDMSELLTVLKDYTHITTLNLASVNPGVFSSANLSAIASLPDLSELDISDNGINAFQLRGARGALQGNRSLTKLKIGNNNLVYEGKSDAYLNVSLRTLLAIPSLIELDISNTNQLQMSDVHLLATEPHQLKKLNINLSNPKFSYRPIDPADILTLLKSSSLKELELPAHLKFPPELITPLLVKKVIDSDIPYLKKGHFLGQMLNALKVSDSEKDKKERSELISLLEANIIPSLFSLSKDRISQLVPKFKESDLLLLDVNIDASPWSASIAWMNFIRPMEAQNTPTLRLWSGGAPQEKRLAIHGDPTGDGNWTDTYIINIDPSFEKQLFDKNKEGWEKKQFNDNTIVYIKKLTRNDPEFTPLIKLLANGHLSLLPMRDRTKEMSASLEKEQQMELKSLQSGKFQQVSGALLEEIKIRIKKSISDDVKASHADKFFKILDDCQNLDELAMLLSSSYRESHQAQESLSSEQRKFLDNALDALNQLTFAKTQSIFNSPIPGFLNKVENEFKNYLKKYLDEATFDSIFVSSIQTKPEKK